MLLLLLPMLASGAPSPGPCCSSKTVGGLLYTFVREDSSALSLSCLSPCVYERTGGAGGPQYCFTKGEQKVICGNATSSGSGDGIEEIMKKFPGARKPGIYWDEKPTELYNGANFTNYYTLNCSSQLFCSSAKDPLIAFVLIEPEKFNVTDNYCDIADGLILEEYHRNITGVTTAVPTTTCPGPVATPHMPAGIPNGLQLVNGSCPAGSAPLTVTVAAPLGCGNIPDSALNFCPSAEYLFKPPPPISCLKPISVGWVPIVCCCLTPAFKNNKIVCDNCKNIFNDLNCPSSIIPTVKATANAIATSPTGRNNDQWSPLDRRHLQIVKYIAA